MIRPADCYNLVVDILVLGTENNVCYHNEDCGASRRYSARLRRLGVAVVMVVPRSPALLALAELLRAQTLD